MSYPISPWSQRLCVVSMPSGAVRSAIGEFRVLELHAFDGGVVRGVDSPVHMPQAVALSVEDLMTGTFR